MEPIRSRTPSLFRESRAGSQPDAVQPRADQRASAPAGGPLDGLPARPIVSRAQLPLSPASLPTFSQGSFGDLLHEVDLSFFEALPSLSFHHTEAAPDALDEVQSALRAPDDPQPPVGVSGVPLQPATHTAEAASVAHLDLNALGYSQSQQDKIKPQVRSVVARHHHALIGHGFTHAHIVELSKHPPALATVAARYPDIIAALPDATHEDIVGVGKQWSGARALEALITVTAALREPPLQLVTGQLLKVARNGGVTAVQEMHAARNVLTAPPLRLTPAQVVAIACHDGGKQALNTVQRLLPVLCNDHGLTPDQVVAIASNDGGKQALETVERLLPVLCNDHGLTSGQVVAIASNSGGKQALETVQRLLPALCNDHGLTPHQVVSIASNIGGRQALETVQRRLPLLCKEHGLTPDQVVAIARNGGGKQALEAVQRLLPVLCKDHCLTPDQVVAIARNGGGKQALETVQRLLSVLCEEHGLTPDQVVAIASKGGSKQALETVQRLLPRLCRDHGLTPDQVVAIASHNGGKQALEAVQRLLPVLCKEHGLSPRQVVAIASHDGGKQALEAVQRLLPVLCKDHGLTPKQVVSIASDSGGSQALERVFARLSCPDPALAALPNDRLVALACLGGRPALEAIIKGLPHAPMSIRKANRRVRERTFHRVADPAHVVQVLNFFQCHPRPLNAFDEAMQQFGMSRSGLLQLFRRVGVTELEARSGTLPPASQRWQRILQALEGQPASAPTPTPAPPQESWHAFADSLERDLDVSSPMQEADQAFAGTSRKRPRSEDSSERSPQQPHQAPVPEQPDALHAHLPGSWALKRPRPQLDGDSPDSATTAGADLAASSTVFVEKQAATDEDFPAFNHEEMAWLMELLL